MTSLKRAFVDEYDSSDPSGLSTSVTSSQRCRTVGPENISQAAEYRGGGWGGIWHEVIGGPHIEHAANNLTFIADGQIESDLDVPFRPQVKTSVESWATEEAHWVGGANDVDFNTNFDGEVIEGDGDNGSSFSLCYGMVSVWKQVV